MLLNPTNGSSYTGTILQTQQVAASRLRALETDRWVVQVAPTGLSAFVTPGGHVFDRTGISEEAVRVRDVGLREGTTPYVHLGDLPVLLLAAGMLAASLVLSRLDRSRRPDRADLEEHGDRAVVDQLQGHVGPEPARGDAGAEPG